MTRKDFKVIAQALVEVPNAAITPEAYKAVCQYMADNLQGTNERFNRSKFLQACGL